MTARILLAGFLIPLFFRMPKRPENHSDGADDTEQNQSAQRCKNNHNKLLR